MARVPAMCSPAVRWRRAMKVTWEALIDPAQHPAGPNHMRPSQDKPLHCQPAELAPRGPPAQKQGDGLELLTAILVLARARVPGMTALQKPDGGVRGIATGGHISTVPSSALAKTPPQKKKTWAATFDETTCLYQHALSARTCMDALVAGLRIALDTDPDVTVVCPWIAANAYDTMSRAALLRNLHQLAPALLPLVRLFYGQPSAYCWWDASGDMP